MIRHAQDEASLRVALAELGAGHARLTARGGKRERAPHVEASVAGGEALDECEAAAAKLALNMIEERPGLVVRDAARGRERANLAPSFGAPLGRASAPASYLRSVMGLLPPRARSAFAMHRHESIALDVIVVAASPT